MRFSRLIRRVRSEEPQRAMVHDETTSSSSALTSLKSDLRSLPPCKPHPYREIDIEPRRTKALRDADLKEEGGRSRPYFSLTIVAPKISPGKPPLLACKRIAAPSALSLRISDVDTSNLRASPFQSPSLRRSRAMFV